MSHPIEFTGIWKKFRKGDKVYALRDLIPQMAKGMFQKTDGNGGLKQAEFWALRDVNFHVKKGEVVGIIGHNGAGKSTILKLLSRILKPDKGEFHVRGRLSALIEVTAGFHPDFTGRENVYFNGSVYGMTRAELNKKFDQIVDFSGVREFIDTPVKRYSSGMSARLGFAIASHVDPDVLLVDEVLSVGDMRFQAKCLDKIKSLMKSGTTIVFISHNIPMVQSLCERVILLEKGSVIKEGHPDEVIPFYETSIHRAQQEEIRQRLEASEEYLDVEESADIQIKNVTVIDAAGRPTEEINLGDPIRVRMDYEVKGSVEEVHFTYEIIRSDGISCASSNTKDDNTPVKNPSGRHTMTIDLGPLQLRTGTYLIRTAIFDKDMIHPLAERRKTILTVVTDKVDYKSRSVFYPPTRWKHD